MEIPIKDRQKLHDYEIQKDRFIAKNEIHEAATLCNKIGNLYAQHLLFEDALQSHEQELQFSLRLRDKLSEGIAHRRIADCLKSMGHFENALESCGRFMAAVSEVGDLVEIQRAEATMASVLIDKFVVTKENMSDFARRDCLYDAEKYLERSLKSCGKLANSGKVDAEEVYSMKTHIFKNLAMINELKEDETNCLKYLEKYKDLAKKKKKMADLVDVHLQFSSAYLRGKRPDEALDSVKEGIEMAFSEHARLPKSKREETIRLKAHCLIQLNRYRDAAKSYQECQKLIGKSGAEGVEDIKRIVKRLLKIHFLLENLQSCPDLHLKLKLLEKLGDNCSHPSISNNEAALQFYIEQESVCQQLKKESKFFQPIYCSIAETNCDLKNYSAALEYYQKELKSWNDNHLEVSNTLAKIADIQEKNEESLGLIQETYEKAGKRARKSGDTRQILGILEKWLAFLARNDKSDEIKDASTIKDNITAEIKDLDVETEESPEDALEEIDEESDPDFGESDLSGDSDVEASVAAKLKAPKQIGRRGAVASEPKNLRGETALHEAAKAGDYKRVKKLMEMKKRVNTHDFTGISPIHDACLAGYSNVVSLLLIGGADVEDPGENWKESKTPFLCAAAGGHVAIMKLLRLNGARVDARDYLGRNFRDHLENYLDDPEVVSFIEELNCDRKSQDNVRFDSDLEQQYLDLFSTADCSDVQSTSSKDPTFKPKSDIMISTSEFETAEDATVTESSSDFALENLGRKGVDLELPGVEVYQREMHRIGSSAVSRVSAETEDSSEPFLQSSDDDYVEDDWLVDDLNTSSRWKSKKRSLAETFIDAGAGGGNRPASGVALKNKKPKLSSLARVTQSKSAKERIDSYVQNKKPADRVESKTPEPSSRSSSHFAKTGRYKQQKLTSIGVEVASRSPSPIVLDDASDSRPCPDLVLTSKSITVNVNSHAFLIPLPKVEDDTKLSWLCNEASDRYSKRFGAKPYLSLRLSTGVILDPDDPISLLQGAKEVFCAVDSWKVASAEEIYRDSCAALGLRPVEAILEKFQLANGSRDFSLSDVVLESSPSLLAVIRALNGHELLQTLSFEMTILFDEEWIILSNALKSLKNLKTLNIASCGMFYENLSQIKDQLCEIYLSESRQNSICRSLTSLNISNNCLGDESVDNIISIVQYLFSLTSFKLENICLTEPDTTMCKILKHTNISDIKVSETF